MRETRSGVVTPMDQLIKEIEDIYKGELSSRSDFICVFRMDSCDDATIAWSELESRYPSHKFSGHFDLLIVTRRSDALQK